MDELRSITLNVSPTSPPSEWEKVAEVYRSLDGWIEDAVWPCWYGTTGTSTYITASSEPSGLLFTGNVDATLWTGWVSVLCARLSLALGREIRDAEM